MNWFGKSKLGVAGLGILFGLGAGSANAQQASFTLPFEAHWGQAVLQPGEYKVHFPSGADSSRVVQVLGNGKIDLIVPQVTDYRMNETGIGHLTLVNDGGIYKVTGITDITGGRNFSFAVPGLPRSR